MEKENDVCALFSQLKPEVAYLDSAATTLMPAPVLTAVTNFLARDYAAVHRATYPGATKATAAYEAVRVQVAQWVNAPNVNGVIFTSGATASLNLLAQGLIAPNIMPGQKIVVSELEHNANFVVWQQIAAQTGAKLEIIAATATGAIDCDQAEELIDETTAIVSVTGASNVTGAVNDLAHLSRIAHAHNALFAVDGAQLLPHRRVDMQQLGIDFLAFSAHKLYGPTGVGCLIGRPEYLESLQPQTYGGGMVNDVTATHTTFAPLPARLEAGTPNISGVIGLGAALTFLQTHQAAFAHQEQQLQQKITAGLARISGVQLVVSPAVQDSVGIVSFTVANWHAHDVATALAQANVWVRAGQHCAMIWHHRHQLPATVRVSLAGFTTVADCEQLLAAVKQITLHRPAELLMKGEK